MRYTQTKDQSAELLRAALQCMGQHDAALNPISFAVWYEFSAGINAKLNEDVARSVDTEPRLGDETIYRLFREHIAEADATTLQQISTQLRASMDAMLEGAARTGERAGLFGEQLTQLGSSLSAGDPVAVTAGLRNAAAQPRSANVALRPLAQR